MEDREALLRTFQASFFAMTRLSPLHWERLRGELEKDKSSELIAEVLKKTSLSPLAQKHPPSAKYRRSFLTELITMLEQMCLEPLDELYEGLAAVLNDQESEDCYKTYLLLPSGGAVTLTESVALVSQGTTGLVTWEAGLQLAEWALEHQEPFSGRVVLELGCGVGLTGLVVCSGCRPSRYVFSDFHPSVLRRLRANLELNGLGEGPPGGGEEPPGGGEGPLGGGEGPPGGGEGPPGGAQGGGVVRVEELDWESVSEERLREIGADTVIASDVVYDPDLLPGLVRLLSVVLRCSSPGGPQVFICSPIRNPDTYNSFKRQLEEAGISHEVISGAGRQVLSYHRAASIQMIQLTLRTQ